MFEFLQWSELGWSYWGDIQNWFDTSSTIINLVMLLKYDFFYDQLYGLGTQQTLAAVAVGLIWFKLFTWMRIYDPTAFFMRLLAETFKDIFDFFIMFLVIISAFANVFYILNFGKMLMHEGALYEHSLESDILNSWITEYKIGLGSFDTSSYEGTNDRLIWLIWFASTFLIQITFLNMLIAIMGNTFDKVMDKRQLSALKERINIMQDYRKVVTFLRLD